MVKNRVVFSFTKVIIIKYLDLAFYWIIYKYKRDIKTSSFRILVYSTNNVVQRKNVRYIIYIISWEIHNNQNSKREKFPYLYTIMVLLCQNSLDDFYVQPLIITGIILMDNLEFTFFNLKEILLYK